MDAKLILSVDFVAKVFVFLVMILGKTDKRKRDDSP